MASRRTTQKSGNWLSRLFANWWRARMYWKLGKTILSMVRSFFSKRSQGAAKRR